MLDIVEQTLSVDAQLNEQLLLPERRERRQCDRHLVSS